MSFNETLKNELLHEHLQLISFWSHHNSRWPPQLTDITHHKNSCNSVTSTDICPEFNETVDESQTRHVL